MFEMINSDLLMYIDNVASAKMRRAIEQDPQVLAQVRPLKDLHNRITQVLYRFNCPGSDLLGEYFLGQLPLSEQKKIAEHLSRCILCRRELEVMEVFFKPTLVERIVARLVSGGKQEGALGWLPAYGERGAIETPFIYEAGDIQIAIDVQEDNLHPARKAIIGLISGAPSKDFEVTVWMEGGQPMMATVDELNYFKVDNLVQGEYEVLIRGPKLEILVQKFMIT
ncbi:MAG: hypothetical protein Fur0022_19550 [Anaerolineales bacterium]